MQEVKMGLEEIVTAGGMSLLGSWYDNRNDTKNMREQNQFNADQASISRKFTAGQAEIDRELQRFYAENGLRMRVEDAVAAGLHPLVGAGLNPASYQPVNAVGAQASSSGYVPSHMGQDISRALITTMSKDERHERIMMKAAEDRAELENLLLGAKIAETMHVGPGLPSNSGMPLLTGQGDSHRSDGTGTGAYVIENPLQRTHSQPGQPQQEVGSIADYAYVKTATGYAIVPSYDVKQRIEDQLIPEMMWAWRNQIVPMLKGLPAPDPRYYKPPEGYDDWEWSPMNQEFRPIKRPRRDYLYSAPTF